MGVQRASGQIWGTQNTQRSVPQQSLRAEELLSAEPGITAKESETTQTNEVKEEETALPVDVC